MENWALCSCQSLFFSVSWMAWNWASGWRSSERDHLPLLLLIPPSGQDWGFSRFADGKYCGGMLLLNVLISILSLASMVVGASLPPMGISLLAHGCKLMTGRLIGLATVLVQEGVCTYRAMPLPLPWGQCPAPFLCPVKPQFSLFLQSPGCVSSTELLSVSWTHQPDLLGLCLECFALSCLHRPFCFISLANSYYFCRV